MTARELTLAVDFDCGDDQGRITGHFESVEVYTVQRGKEEHALSLNGPRTKLSLSDTQPTIAVGDRHFLRERGEIRCCVGNFAWHGAHLMFEEGERLIRYLKEVGFQPEEYSNIQPTVALVKELWP